MTNEGVLYDYDHPERFSRVAFTVDEIQGTTTHVGDELQLATLDTILYHVNGSGFLAPQYMLARTAQGAEFEYGHYSFSPDIPFCCQVTSVVLCEPNPMCDEGNCPGPDDCACTGTGSCVEVTGSQYRGGRGSTAGCPGQNNHECQQVCSTPVTCDCKNP